uniref:Uncharacterized protein n=1 Tax=Anguilla anguilla TaxID=7936 RepID=A0A0E9QNT9_ANGAN
MSYPSRRKSRSNTSSFRFNANVQACTFSSHHHSTEKQHPIIRKSHRTPCGRYGCQVGQDTSTIFMQQLSDMPT